MTPTTARVIYPELPKPLTPSDLYQLFRPSYVEREWVPTIARIPSSQVALLVQLKIFQTIGRFLGAADIPPAAIEYVASHMGVEHVSVLISRTRTFYRHRRAILQHLKVISWGTEAFEGVDLFSLSKVTVGNLALAWGWFGKLMIPLTILSIFQSVSDGVDA